MNPTTPIHRAPDSPAARQALALAGVFQAASLVDELARTGQVDPRAWETLIEATVDTTLEALVGRKQANPVVLRYGFSLLMLMNKLRTNTGMMDSLGQKLTRIQGQAEHFGPTHENVVASLGEAYQETISTFKTRIVVQGDPSLLQSRMMPERVRACLMAGIRFGLLWHQQGGRRWKLVFQRKALRRALDSLN